MLEPLNITIDEREQRPWGWLPSDAKTRLRSLVAGDYALNIDTWEIPGKRRLGVRFAIERKSFDDFLGTISSGWDRFIRELARMESFPARVVIVEGDFRQCCFERGEAGLIPPPHNHPSLRPSFVARRISELALMDVQVLFAGDQFLAAGLALRLFRRRYEQCRMHEIQ